MLILTQPQIIPRGVIIKFTGLIADIYEGFALCDGTNGTPDLRSKFVRGINSNVTDPGNTGGADTVTLSTPELPSHTHSTTETAHSHSMENTPPSSNAATASIDNAIAAGHPSGASSLAGVSVGNTGSGGAHENRPAYYEVLFIMKVSDL